MEPMADGSVSVKRGIDRGKFRMGLRDKKAEMRKRKREDDPPSHRDGEAADNKTTAPNDDHEVERPIKKKRVRGPKGPNPLSVKKPKKRMESSTTKKSNTEIKGDAVESLSMSQEQGAAQQQPLSPLEETINVDVVERPLDPEAHNKSSPSPSPRKKKRKRKHNRPLSLILDSIVQQDAVSSIQ